MSPCCSLAPLSLIQNTFASTLLSFSLWLYLVPDVTLALPSLTSLHPSSCYSYRSSFLSTEDLLPFPELFSDSSRFCLFSWLPTHTLKSLTLFLLSALTQLLPRSGLGLLSQEANATRIGAHACPCCRGNPVFSCHLSFILRRVSSIPWDCSFSHITSTSSLLSHYTELPVALGSPSHRPSYFIYQPPFCFLS